MLTLQELEADVRSGAIDTVLLVMTDMQGRLMGKRRARPVLRGRDRARTAPRAATTC